MWCPRGFLVSAPRQQKLQSWKMPNATLQYSLLCLSQFSRSARDESQKTIFAQQQQKSSLWNENFAMAETNSNCLWFHLICDLKISILLLRLLLDNFLSLFYLKFLSFLPTHYFAINRFPRFHEDTNVRSERKKKINDENILINRSLNHK